MRKFHYVDANGRPLCGATCKGERTVITVPHVDLIPLDQRCQRRACRDKWPPIVDIEIFLAA